MSRTFALCLRDSCLLLCLLTLAACTGLSSKNWPLTVLAPPPPYAAEDQGVHDLIAEAPRLVALAAEEGKLEQLSANTAFAQKPNELARLRLALFLTLGVGGRNDGRLQSLLDEAESRSAASDSPYRQLWNVLVRMSAERVRIQHDAQARNRDLELRLREAQARADDLQAKLDALKSVERTLNKRSRHPEKISP
jgi:chaperonin cofactor prefoldin